MRIHPDMSVSVSAIGQTLTDNHTVAQALDKGFGRTLVEVGTFGNLLLGSGRCGLVLDNLLQTIFQTHIYC